MMKKLLLVLVVILAVMPLVACKSSDNLVAVQSITFYESTIELGVNESVQLQYKILPVNATNKNVQFSSSDPSVVSVTDDGLATLNRKQSATVTVRSTDGTSGSFVAYCKIEPAADPEEIVLDNSQVEAKRVGNETKNFVMLSVGQTKSLPIIVSPEKPSANRLDVSVDGNSVEAKLASEWLIVGKKAGDSIVNVTTVSSDGTKKSCMFNVRVQEPVTNIELHKIDAKGNSTATKVFESVSKVNENLYTSTVGLTSNEDVYLELALKNSTSSNIVQYLQNVKVSALVSDESVFESQIIDGYSEYEAMLEKFSNTDRLAYVDSFNMYKYIYVNPLVNSESTLYLLTDAIASNGLPIQIQINIMISDEPTSVDLSVRSLSTFDDFEYKEIAIVGEPFCLDVEPIAITAGDNKSTVPLGIRKVYYVLDSVSKIRPIGKYEQTSGASLKYLTETNGFIALDEVDSIIITVWVSKENSADVTPITELRTDQAKGELYVKGTIEIKVQKRPQDIYLSYNNKLLIDGDKIAAKNGLDIALEKGVFGTDFTISKEGDESFAWDFDVSSDNANVVEVLSDGSMRAKAPGQCSITIRLIGYKEPFTKTITIYVYQ